MDDLIARHQQTLARNPANELARFSLGKAWFDRQRFAEAREHFAAALERKPDWMAVEILLAKCHLHLGDRVSAEKSLRHAAQLARAQNHRGPLAEVEQLLDEHFPDGSGGSAPFP